MICKIRRSEQFRAVEAGAGRGDLVELIRMELFSMYFCSFFFVLLVFNLSCIDLFEKRKQPNNKKNTKKHVAQTGRFGVSIGAENGLYSGRPCSGGRPEPYTS